MTLKIYKKKRDFKSTPEPTVSKRKKVQKRNKPIFVIQKHGARHLHYDLRLEMKGVLKSWAVPKGPSLDPKIKRLAVEVEDHPMDYANFEGNIPWGKYGAGPVLIWDRGTWECTDDPYKAYKKGDITFELKGKKLQGLWKLIRFNLDSEEGEHWLFFKMKDDFSNSKLDIVKSMPLSITSGLTLEDLENQKEVLKKKTPNSTDPFPSHFKPTLATLGNQTPKGDDWIHEVKFDGYRLICMIKNKKIKLLTRNNLDWTDKFPFLVDELKNLPLKNGILDGELVVLNKKGISDFQLLQNFIKNQKTSPGVVRYYVFDLPFLNGSNLMKRALIDRKKQLKDLFADWVAPHEHIVYTDHIQGQGEWVYKKACQGSLEGIISKNISSHYEQKRSLNWVKSKCLSHQEFVIGGYTKPKGNREYFGALLLGYYNNKKQFIYAGKVGTGFTQKLAQELYPLFSKLIQKKSSFQDVSNVDSIKEVIWIKPCLVAEIKFSSWTQDALLRHASFLGLRKEKKSIPQFEVELTHPDKILIPTQTITKQELATYYDKISDLILPFIINRPLLLLRCPGNDKKCFFQKHYHKTLPKGIHKIRVSEKNEKEPKDYVMIKDKKGLMSLIQMDVLEIHPWGSTIKNIEKPDKIIFDLDPDPTLDWKKVVEGALILHKELKKLGLKNFVKTSGGKGLHIVIPLIPKRNWAAIKLFSQTLASQLAEQYPDLFTATLTKTHRKGKIYIDYLRNTRGSTAVAPYSTRALKDAPISLPISWRALKLVRSANQFTVKNYLNKSKKPKVDPWKGFTFGLT